MKHLEAKLIVSVVIGVVLAGLAMNALRSNSLVKNAINGFDA